MMTTVKIILNPTATGDPETPSQQVARLLREYADKIDGHPHFSSGFSTDISDNEDNGRYIGFLSVS